MPDKTIGDTKKSPSGDLGVQMVGKVGVRLPGILLRHFDMNKQKNSVKNNKL